MSAPQTSDLSAKPDVLIIGAGPAGLTAARQLDQAGINSVVVEKDDIVGGISRTVSHNGYHFDIGGHRFFTKVKAVDDVWHAITHLAGQHHAGTMPLCGSKQ